MTLYSVYEHEGEAPVAVADRFSWSAALVPPVHALAHGLWLMLGVWIIGLVAIAVLGILFGGDVAFWLYVLFAILIGFEASTFRRRRVGNRGARYRGEIIAPAEDLAEVEYLRRRVS